MSQIDITPSMQIDLFTHGVKVTRFNHIGKNALLEYCRGLAQFGLVRVGRNRFERQMLRVFVGVTNDRSEFRFHRNQYNDLRYHLNRFGFTDQNIRIVEHKLYEPQKCTFPLKDLRPPHAYQIPIIDYLIADCAEKHAPSKVVTLQTGKGKTFLALQAVEKIGQRVFMVIKGMYVDKWIPDVEAAFHLKKGDLMVVRGADHLKAIIELAQADELKAKFIICTSKTMFNYIKSYEQFKSEDLGYHVAPEDLFKTLKIGIRLIDEVHQDFHCNYRQDLYTHVPKTISLSATLDSDDPFMNNIYEVTWPRHTRAPEVAYDKFIAMKALWYSINEPHKIRCKNAMKQYSHTKFEQSIMKHPDMLRGYLNMISSVVHTSFIRVYEEGQKMLIFCGTIEMCTVVRNHLARILPTLKVERYTESDDYETFLAADIGVSTIQSAGTAIDIPNLRITFMTVALSSKQANIQVLGRTRRLKDWPDVTPEFIFLSAREIQKHHDYTQGKGEKLEGKVLSFRELQTDFRV